MSYALRSATRTVGTGAKKKKVASWDDNTQEWAERLWGHTGLQKRPDRPLQVLTWGSWRSTLRSAPCKPSMNLCYSDKFFSQPSDKEKGSASCYKAKAGKGQRDQVVAHFRLGIGSNFTRVFPHCSSSSRLSTACWLSSIAHSTWPGTWEVSSVFI